MPASFKLRSQLTMVIDLAIEDNPDRPVFVGHGLVSARQVDNAQAAKTKPHRTQNEFTPVIGAPMTDSVRHGPQLFGCKVTAASKIDNSANSTHRSSLLPETLESRRAPSALSAFH